MSEATPFEAFMSAFNAVEAHFQRTLYPKRESGFPGFRALLNEYQDRGKHAMPRQTADHLQVLAELRNALAHGQSHNDQRLAEPTATAVAEMRRVRDLLLKPPTVIAVLKPGKPFVAGPQESVRDVLERMYANDFSQVPVYDGNDYVGLLTTNTVARWVAVQMARNDGLAEDSSVEEALTFGEGPENVRHLRKQTSAPEAVRLFVGAAERGEPLAALILTESGKRMQTPVAMVVPADLPRLVDAAT